MDYAIIRVGNKQHRVRDGETLVVDRLRTDEGGTFEPEVLLGGDGVKVTATVLGHGRGPKIRIGKYRRRTGYKRHNGFRAATTQIEISLGGSASKRSRAKAAEEATPVDEAPAEETGVEATPEAATETAAETPEEAAPEEAAAEEAAAPEGLPEGYDDLTVAAIGKDAKDWDRAQLEAALAYEQEHAARKGAIAALESALAAQDEEEESDGA